MAICPICGNDMSSSKCWCYVSGDNYISPSRNSKIDNITIEQLTNEEILIISNYIANDYVPHEEPARSAILKLHRIAEKYR